jgi:small subunit ribosomal protein S3
MGHKVHPTGIRLGIAKDWNSKWFANKRDYATYLVADIKVRDMLKKKLAAAGISRIQIERPAKTARVTIHTARPGVVIGKKGEDIEKLRKEVSDMMGVPTHINVSEVRKPEIDAQLVAESIAQQLERRIMFRRAMKRSVGNAMRLGALGIKINVSGRLNGAEIARSEWSREGRVPLHTLRADIDYGTAEAKTIRARSLIWPLPAKSRKMSRHPRSRAAKVAKVVVMIRVARPVTAAASGRPSKESCHVATEANQIPQAVQGP